MVDDSDAFYPQSEGFVEWVEAHTDKLDVFAAIRNNQHSRRFISDNTVCAAQSLAMNKCQHVSGCVGFH